MQMTGMDKETRIAKIQAGVGQGSTGNNDIQVTTDELKELEDFRKSIKSD